MTKHILIYCLIHSHKGFPGGSVVKNHLPTQEAQGGDTGLIPGSGSFPGGGNVNPSNALAWKIPWTEEPRGLQSMGSQRVRHNSANEDTHIRTNICVAENIIPPFLSWFSNAIISEEK